MMMISSISLIIAMSDYIITSNNILIMLKDNIDSFEKEARIIDEAKCYLINYDTLDDFEYLGVSAYEVGNYYYINYDGLNIKLEVKDGMILSYSYE